MWSSASCSFSSFFLSFQPCSGLLFLSLCFPITTLNLWLHCLHFDLLVSVLCRLVLMGPLLSYLSGSPLPAMFSLCLSRFSPASLAPLHLASLSGIHGLFPPVHNPMLPSLPPAPQSLSSSLSTRTLSPVIGICDFPPVLRAHMAVMQRISNQVCFLFLCFHFT